MTTAEAEGGCGVTRVCGKRVGLWNQSWFCNAACVWAASLTALLINSWSPRRTRTSVRLLPRRGRPPAILPAFPLRRQAIRPLALRSPRQRLALRLRLSRISPGLRLSVIHHISLPFSPRRGAAASRLLRERVRSRPCSCTLTIATTPYCVQHQTDQRQLACTYGFALAS